MKCPVCDVTLSISSREGVEIDFCPQCRGVWLDRGELDKILDRVAAAPAELGGRDHRDDRDERRFDDRDRPRDDDRDRYRDDRARDDNRYAKKRKRRSLLDDLFEFD